MNILINYAALTLLAVSAMLGFAIGRIYSPPRRVIRNPRPHRAADEVYVELTVDNEKHFFTVEQMLTARERARRLTGE